MISAYQQRILFLFFLLCFLTTLFLKPANAEPFRSLNILTSFPPRFYTPFVIRFEAIYPDIKVSVLNKKTTAALDEIQRGNLRHFDIFWSSSADAFDILKSVQALSQSNAQRDYETVSIDGIDIDDSQGFFYGFALSGVGWMWNSQYLSKEQLPVPQHWSDLDNPAYYGHIAMSTPARSGTTHMIVENFLQEHGWEDGWKRLLMMAGNFATVTARSFSVPEGIASGRFGIGLVIDFLALARQNSDIQFRYGEPVFLVPASIAKLKGGQDEDAADLFLNFILSEEGQKILLNPGIRRLPISQNLFVDNGAQASNLKSLMGHGRVQAFNVRLSRQRYQLVNLLFERLVTFKLRERRKLWNRLLKLEKRHPRNSPDFQKLKTDILSHLTALPVSSEESISPHLLGGLKLISNGDPRMTDQKELIKQWDRFIDRNLAQASSLLDKADHLPAGKKE